MAGKLGRHLFIYMYMTDGILAAGGSYRFGPFASEAGSSGRFVDQRRSSHGRGAEQKYMTIDDLIVHFIVVWVMGGRWRCCVASSSAWGCWTPSSRRGLTRAFLYAITLPSFTVELLTPLMARWDIWYWHLWAIPIVG